MDIEIVYYEQEGGVLQKVAELVVQTQKDASLGEICKEALQKVRIFNIVADSDPKRSVVMCRK